MNQLNLNQKAGAELLSLRPCFVCGREIYVRNIRSPNYCSPECYDARDYAGRYVNKEKGIIPKDIQATIRQRFSRQGAQREWEKLAEQDKIDRQKRLDEAHRSLGWNEKVKAMWR